MGAGARREGQDVQRHHPLLVQGTARTYGRQRTASGFCSVSVRGLPGLASDALQESVDSLE